MRSKRRWDRSQYPDNWEQMSYEFRASKNFTCEHCGYRQGDELVSRAGKIYRGTVDAAHKYPNDTRNSNPELLSLCKRDHRIYDNQFQEIIAEGQHQAIMHDIALEQQGYVWCDHPDCQGYYLPHEH